MSNQPMEDGLFEEEFEASAVGDATMVVGVGASAGGLEAFTDLLTYLPPDTGLAFVLVQHLDPHRESILVELLAARTPMPVLQVQDGMPLRPNHIYVAPPNAELTINKYVLHVHPRPKGVEQYRPIDSFFVSLASDLRTSAIGVVLSGTASDGTLGLKHIKHDGGITFAQDASAKFDSMPRTAVAAGVVDFVLSPQAMAKELAAIAKHPYRRGSKIDFRERGSVLTRILGVLQGSFGIDFSEYKRATLLRRLSRRMVLRKTETGQEYLAILQQEPVERQILYDDLLINVTEFFRDPEVLLSAYLKGFPEMLNGRRPAEPIRAWISGCATGEEVYSLAISLIEFLESEGADHPIQIFGTDVSENVIAKARAAVYDEHAMTNVSAERRRRFFVRVNGNYQITSQVREACVFSRHNIAKDPPLSRMDVVSCRNLLIYFSARLQRRVIATFAYALRTNGILILGPSESLGSLAEYFDVADEKSKIYRRGPKVCHSGVEATERIRVGAQMEAMVSRFEGERSASETGVTSLPRQVDRLLLARFNPAAVLVDAELRILEMRGDVNGFFQFHFEGERNIDLRSALRPELSADVSALLERVRTGNNVGAYSAKIERFDSSGQPLQVTVSPLIVLDAAAHYLIVFEWDAVAGEPADSATAAGDPRDGSRHLEGLQRQLRATREQLQSVLEEQRSTNEEAQSANEELQSINEELQTAKEELQSSNEELNTINAEMQSRNSELVQLNDDLLNLLGSMNMPVVMVGGDLRVRRFTPMAERVLHLIPADVGRPISDLKPRINVPSLHDTLRGVLDTLTPHEQEVQGADGNWYQMRVRPYRTSDNRIQGAVLQLIDVSALKGSMEEIRRARDYSQGIVDTVREPLVVLDHSLQLQNANRSFYQFFGVTMEGAANQTISEVANGAFRGSALETLLREMIGDGTRINDLEMEYRHPKNGVRHLLVNVRQMRPAENQGLLLLAFEDVTERKRAEEARYRRLFESAKDGIVLLDAATGMITDVNPFLLDLCGYTREEMVGQLVWETPPFRESEFNKPAYEQVREQGVVRFSELMVTTKDGRKLTTEVIANRYSEKNGQSIQMNVRDMTERKKFEQDLQHTQKLESLGLLAGGIAHDFNNLLTGILGNASLAYSDTPPDQPTRGFMRSIMDAAQRAAFLTQQMLAYAGRGRFVTRPLELGKLVQEIAPLIHTSIPRSVELRLDLDAGAPQVEADPGQLQQVVMNLIINGAEAIPEDQSGRVVVRTGVRDLSEEESRTSFANDGLEPGQYVTLEVKDSGVGMSEETRSRIFDPFFTTKFTGRGLGLAAVQGIVRSHRGSIRVYSAAGAGSTFQVMLPAAKAPAPTVAPSKQPRGVMAKGTVLAVDDEGLIRELAGSILTRNGFRVLKAENGRAAVEILSRNPQAVSVVLLDLLMPVMGGEETLGRLREIRPDVPIILSSGFDESEAMRRFAGKNISAFVQKPYDSDGLIQAVNQALTRQLQ